VWTSGAHLADIGEILCRTAEEPRHRNLTMFVVDMQAPGVEVRPLRQMTGGAAFNEVFLDDVWIPDSDRLGDVDGGWGVAMTTLANERSAIGGSGFGGKGLLSMDRLGALVRHCERSDDPIVRQEVAALLCGLRTASWTRRRFAAEGRTASLGPVLKLALCRDLSALAGIISECLGPSLLADTGEWGTYAWANFIVGLPGYRIGGGTDEVLKSVVAERALGLPRERPAS
jgi:alkylation response protein AidB-like acyl-CoA dehydrogenase